MRWGPTFDDQLDPTQPHRGRTDAHVFDGHDAGHLLGGLLVAVRDEDHGRPVDTLAGQPQVDEEAGEALAELREIR